MKWDGILYVVGGDDLHKTVLYLHVQKQRASEWYLGTLSDLSHLQLLAQALSSGWRCKKRLGLIKMKAYDVHHAGFN